MSGGPMKLIEQHLEKAVLGLGVLVLLAMAFLFLIRSPNTVEYKGQPVGASGLDEAIKSSADALAAAVTKAKPPEVSVTDYSAELVGLQTAGIGEAATPLRLAAEFGAPIPTIHEEEESSGDVVLVTPLKPTAPVLRTGRSEVIPRPIVLGAAPTSPPTAEAGAEKEAVKPVELPWTTVAAYFSRKSQQEEMIKAKYATSKSKVYLAGLDVQRQEVLASGEYSDWQDVANSKAVPKADIPDPQMDESSGEIKNDRDIKEAWALVKASQVSLVEPEFYEVEAGDYWEMPPLEGYEDTEDSAEEAKPVKPVKTEKEPVKRAAPAPRPRPGGGGGGGIVGGGGGIVGGGGGFIGGGGGATRAPVRSNDASVSRQAKKDGEERGKQDLITARAAYGRKSYGEAQQAARRVLDSEHAKAGDKSQAKKVLRLAERKLAQEQHAQSAGGGGGGTGVVSTGGGGGGIVAPGGGVVGAGGGSISVAGGGRDVRASAGGGGAAMHGPGGTERAGVFVTHPEDNDKLAVWFHDDSVEAGKTYRYRMRVKLWNRYVGQMKAVKNPEQAKHTLLVGEWSLPSTSVAVAPSTHFFVGGMTQRKDGARIDVWKWHKGNWLKESFDVGLGDVIGSSKKVKTGELDTDNKEIREDVDFTTGAIVLDLRMEEPVVARTSAGKEGQFKLGERKSLMLVYLDPADGQVKQRVAEFDRYDPLYQKLKEEL